MDSLMGYVDNMAAATMNDGSTFKQYTSNFIKLAYNNTTLANSINKQQKELMEFRHGNNSLKKKLSAAAEPGGGGNERKSMWVSNYDFLW